MAARAARFVLEYGAVGPVGRRITGGSDAMTDRAAPGTWTGPVVPRPDAGAALAEQARALLALEARARARWRNLHDPELEWLAEEGERLLEEGRRLAEEARRGRVDHPAHVRLRERLRAHRDTLRRRRGAG
jgi:hypothetical protein